MEQTITDQALSESGSLRAIVHADPESGYWTEVPDLPGCYTQAETLDELVLNLQEAVEGWLEADALRRQKLPPASLRVRVLEIAA